MRRGVVLVATATALLVASSPGAWAGGQEEPGPGTVVTVPPEPGAETPLPSTTAPAPTTTVPGGTTLPTLPPKCEPLPPAKVVFIGRLTAAAGGVGRFQVDAVRSDPGGLLAIGRLVDVGLGSDLRYLELDSRYLVGAEDDGAGGLRSKVHQPQPLFGGDQVVGLNDADPDCPAFVDPIVVRRADGSAVDTGVFSGFIDDQRGIGLAFLKPAAAVVGVLVGLVLLKYLLIGIGKGSVRAWRRLRYGPAGRRRPLTTPGR